MLPARREGLRLAVLMVMTAATPLGVSAQTPEQPSPAEDTPAQDAPKSPADAPAEGSEAPPEAGDDDWMSEDVAGEEDESEADGAGEDAAGDEEPSPENIDEIVVEYDESGDADKVMDAEGREIEDIPVPVVSKAVTVQDPDRLEPGADKETGVQGQVVSRSPKKVLPDAPVLAKGKDDGRLRSTLTDERGRYRLYLPPGRYTLRSYYDLYHGARWDNILVARGAFKRVNFVLDPISEKDAGVEEQEVIYQADTTSEAAQLAIRKETVVVQDAISAEEIKRAGDSTAKGAVKRVVGVTVDEEGRVIIRGLAGRYNQILLNGVPVPGVDPDIPSVKLDVFPSDIVANLAVVKVPQPDLPGAFAGGLLMVDTTKYPDELEVKVGVSAGFNSLSTFRDMPTYQGGRLDFLGFDDGTRELPGLIGGQRLDVGRGGDGSRYQTRDQVAQVGRSFQNIWNPRTKKALPQLGLKANVGKSGSVGKKDGRGGFNLSFIYDYDEQINTGFNRRLRFDDEGNPTGELLRDFDIKAGNQDVLWGTFGSGFIEPNPDTFLNVTSMFSRVTDDQTLNQLGFTEDTGFDQPQTQDSYNFIGRTVFFNQLTGDHRNLGNTKLRFQWNASGGIGRRDEPDRRLVEQLTDTQGVVRATRFFSDLNQYFVGGTASVRFPVYQAFDSTAYLSFGANGGYQDRDFTARRFVYLSNGNSQLVGDPETIFNDRNLGTISRINEVTRIQDSYVASNTLLGGYAQLETPVAPWLRFQGLLRFEAFQQQVQSQSPFAGSGATQVEGTDRTDLDPLPSANFAFTINDEMFVKIGYGMTVIRPAIRELAPFLYRDFIRGWNIEGNPDLRRTRVQNAEARYEYYFGATDLLAATAFFKYFDDPIEFVIFNQTNSAAGFANADKAWLVGGEVELRLGLARIHEKLKKLFFTGNVAFMKSKTTLPSDPDQFISGNLERPLFNQSPYVTNLSLRFDDPDSRVMVGLVYNAFGKRIVEAGGSAGNVPLPDVFELPQHLLDFIATYKPNPHVKLGLKWKNIAFARVRLEQAGQLVNLKNYGTTVSISAEYIY